MSAAIEDNLDQFIKTVGTFQSMEGSLDTKFYNGLKKIVNNAMKQVSNHTGKYLHNLHEHQPDEDTLQKIIDNVPSSLSYEGENKFDWLPISFAALSKESVHYVPLLAKEGVKNDVGGDDARGGLLSDLNLLELLAYSGDSRETADPLYLDVMKKLRKSKLLLREDIQDYKLLYWACRPETPMRFEYLAGLCPEGLKTHQCKGLSVIHAIIDFGDSIELFSTFLETALSEVPPE